MPKFSEENLQVIRARFNKKAQDDFLLLEGFRHVWNSIFSLDLLLPTEHNTRLAKLVYNIFDYDGDGKVGWDEFIRTVAYLCSGRLRDRLRFGFAVFDIAKQGSINKQYFAGVLACCMDALYEHTDQEQREALIVEFTKLVYENYALADPSTLTLAEYKEAAVGNQIVCYIFTLGIESEIMTIDGTPGISFTDNSGPGNQTMTAQKTPLKSDAPVSRPTTQGDNLSSLKGPGSSTSKDASRSNEARSPDKRRMSRMIAPDLNVMRNHKSGHLSDDGLERAKLEIISLKHKLDEEQAVRQKLESENSKLRAEVEGLKKKLAEAKRPPIKTESPLSATDGGRGYAVSKGPTDLTGLDDPTVIKASWMTKRGNLVRNWKRRYFILGFDHHLRYYESPNDISEKGFINLNIASAAYASTATEAPSFAIDIVTPDRIYTLSCDSKELYSEWLTLLKNIIKKRQDGN